MNIRAVVVDDEALAREKLRTLLEKEPDIEVVGECSDGQSAVEVINAKKPELVFLDIQMPELDGFQVLEQLNDDVHPAVIFVTAYDQFALKAFEISALDYLLKPFDRERFQEALGRARHQLDRHSDEELRDRLKAFLEQLPRKKGGPIDRLVIKSEGRVLFVNTGDLDYIEAAGNYARLHVGEECYLLRETMIGLEKKLDPDKFMRIHRSTIVNTTRIKELQPLFHGEYKVVLQDGTELTLSRGYRENLQKILGASL